MSKSFSILFFVKKTNPNNEQIATLFCRVVVNTNRCEFSLHRKLPLSQWSGSIEKMKGKNSAAEVINDFIDSTRSKIYQHYTELQNANAEITPEALRDRFHGKEELQHTVLSTCAHQNQMAKELMERGELSYDRYLKYTKCVEYLREYNKEKFGKEDILLRSVELQYIREFEHFLLVRKKLKGTSANTYLKLLKKMVRNAFLNNWISKEPFAAYKMKSYKTDIKYLTQEELDRIKAVDFNFERMNTVKDVFIFSCYTGVSYGDMEQLKGTDIQTNAKGESFIARKRGKTDSPYFILLTKPVLDIIEKHKEHCEQTGKLLPVTTNQKLNFYLKELATAAGIDKNLTMHMARHTFATTVALANGISMETLMMILGHTKISTTQHYGKVMNQQVINEMNMLNEKLK
jgi:integrase